MSILTCRRKREIGAERRPQRGRDPGVRRRTLVKVLKDCVSDSPEMGIEDFLAARLAEFGAEALQFLPVECHFASIPRTEPGHVIWVMSFGGEPDGRPLILLLPAFRNSPTPCARW
jgi:hypothetical protein